MHIWDGPMGTFHRTKTQNCLQTHYLYLPNTMGLTLHDVVGDTWHLHSTVSIRALLIGVLLNQSGRFSFRVHVRVRTVFMPDVRLPASRTIPGSSAISIVKAFEQGSAERSTKTFATQTKIEHPFLQKSLCVTDNFVCFFVQTYIMYLCVGRSGGRCVCIHVCVFFFL